ncbi:MAG: ABC transporter permease [Phycisphaerae bacterium]|jgi:lipooligosaccharide transport system permease protein
MNGNSKVNIPPLWWRLYGVWFRHVRVYTRNLFSNALPPFLEPLIFLAGVGLGLSKYITTTMDGLTYIEFLGTGLLMTSAMFTSSFECTFGTFIRLEFDKVYDGMLAAPLTANNLIIGEILWAGSKGFFFSLAVLIILSAFGIISLGSSLAVPLVGFVTGIMFATLAMLVTSFVKTINHFNFYFTGLLSPMFFFSGVVFPISNLPEKIRPVAEILPLTHSVRIARAMCTNQYRISLAGDFSYIVIFIAVVGYFAVRRLRKRMVN